MKQVIECREVAVMGTEAPREFPDSLSRIKLWAIGRQKIQNKTMAVFI